MPQPCRNDHPPLLPAAGSLIHWFELLSKTKILSKYRNINDALIANQKRTATAVKRGVLTENPRWQRVENANKRVGEASGSWACQASQLFIQEDRGALGISFLALSQVP